MVRPGRAPAGERERRVQRTRALPGPMVREPGFHGNLLVPPPLPTVVRLGMRWFSQLPIPGEPGGLSSPVTRVGSSGNGGSPCDPAPSLPFPDDPEGAFVPPEFDVTGNTFEVSGSRWASARPPSYRHLAAVSACSRHAHLCPLRSPATWPQR